jgi:hypothetical protein
VMRKLILQGLGVWLLLLGFAFVNGLFRERVLEPNLGLEPAHILSTTTLAGAVLVAAFLFIATGPRIYSVRELLAIGMIWVLATLFFESFFGHFVLGRSWAALLSDYDLLRGRLFGLVLLAELVGPLMIGLARRRAWRTEHGAASWLARGSRKGGSAGRPPFPVRSPDRRTYARH